MLQRNKLKFSEINSFIYVHNDNNLLLLKWAKNYEVLYAFITEARETKNVSNNDNYIRDYQTQENFQC